MLTFISPVTDQSKVLQQQVLQATEDASYAYLVSNISIVFSLFLVTILNKSRSYTSILFALIQSTLEINEWVWTHKWQSCTRYNIGHMTLPHLFLTLLFELFCFPPAIWKSRVERELDCTSACEARGNIAIVNEKAF